ncbi:MAG: hypothetical protein GY835_24910 [bacterium]|nr:hypothetical protein [bacterium]
MSNEKNQGARIDYKAKSKKLLRQYYEIAEALVEKAHVLATSGDDVRGNEEREGLSTLMHSAEKAIGEIVRLTPMCGTLDDKDSIFRGVDFNLPEYDKSLDNN